MLKAVRDLGEYIIEHEGLSEEEIFIQKTKLSNTKKVICVVFEEKNGNLAYYNTHTEGYEPDDPEEPRKYLYRIFDHKLYDVTPTAKITSIEKVKRRWELWFGQYSAEYRDNRLINSLTDEFLKNKEKIFEDISEKFGELDKNEKRNAILSIKIKNEKEKYVGDFDIFKEIFRKEVTKKFFTRKYDREIESRGNGKCYLCGNEGEVYGFASPFSVFTVKKRGFASQFLQNDSWKQLPICEKCAVFSVAGREFLDKYLSKGFYDYRFYVIPNFIFEGIQKEVIEDIKDSKKKSYAKSLLGREDDILDIIKEKRDVISLIFVFYRPKQGDYFDIVKYVEDVPPSWIKKLFDTFNEIGRKQIFKEESLQKIFGKKWVNDFIEGIWNGKKLRFMSLGGITRTFFPPSRETGVYDKYFLDVIGDILAQRFISKDLLINAFIREIRNEHVNNRYERLYALKSLYLLTFIDELDLIRGVNMSEKTENDKWDIETSKAEKIEGFFEDFKNAFNVPEKKAAFLEGVLAKFLLDVQYAERKSTPFRSKLHGLKIDKTKIKKLLPEIIEKLREYKVGYPWLEELTSKYLLETENSGWRLSKDEISYYFALGLNLGRIFKEKKGEKNE